MWYRPNETLRRSLSSNRRIIRSISALNPVAAGVPVPASDRAVKLISPKKVTRGESSDVMCSTNWPRLNPRGPFRVLGLREVDVPEPGDVQAGIVVRFDRLLRRVMLR